MGLRGVIRNFVFLFIGVELIRFAFFNSVTKSYIGFLGILIIALTVWFLLETFGVIPKLHG